MTSIFAELLALDKPLLADGAMGTNLFNLGLQSGDAPEFWCLEHPDRLIQLHTDFMEAGSDILLTNSFGGNRHRLKLHKAEDRVLELNAAAARLACEARSIYQKSDNRLIAVGGSMGPTGELLEPVGTLSHSDAVAAFAEQARGLADGGADVLWIETLSSQEELSAALEGAHIAAPNLPVVATLSFDTNGRTMMGLQPEEALAVNDTHATPAVAFGANCGTGASSLLIAIRDMRLSQIANAQIASKSGETTPLIAKANCGIPEWVDDKIVYSGTAKIMADYARLAYSLGVKIIGGCCGSYPSHVAAMAKALKAATEDKNLKFSSQSELPSQDEITALLGSVHLPAPPTEADTSRRQRRRRNS